MKYVLGIGLILGLYAFPPGAQNLLQNPGFENGSGTEIPGWLSVSLGPSFKAFEIRTDAPMAGSASVGHLNLNAGGPPDEAVLMQQVTSVSGTFYEATIEARKYSGGLEPLDWHHVGIGLDPWGGTDFFEQGVIREIKTPPPTGGAFQLRVGATAAGSAVTFFIYSKMDQENSAWWAHYFDDAVLVVNTTPTATPTNSPTPGGSEDDAIVPWRIAGTIPDRIYFLPGFVHGDHMFWLQNDSDAILRAELLPGGELAPWTRAANASYRTKWGHPIIPVGEDFVYSVAAWGRVRRARIGTNGEVLDVVPGQTGNKWDYQSMLGEEYILGDRAILWNGAVAAPGPEGRHYLYCLGGFRYTCGPGCGPSNVNEVYWTETLETDDGLLHDWLQGPSLPDSVMSTSGVYHGGSIYAVGGGYGTDPQGGSTTDKIFRAQIHPDGSLRSWTTLSRRLPYSARGIATFAESRYLYVFGGLSAGVTFHSGCYRAPFTSEGNLGEWETLPSLPGPVGLTPSGRRGADLYVTGISSGGVTKVYHTRFREWAMGTATPTPVPSPYPTSDPDQMLLNPSFEQNGGTHTNPDRWRPFRAGGEGLHGTIPEGDFAIAPRPRDGNWMFGSTTDWGHPHGGIFQQVTTEPGDELALLAYGQIYKTDVGGRIRIGIDPTGNTIYSRFTVLWSEWLGEASVWTPFGFQDRNTILAAGPRTTVFLELDSSVERPWNGMYVDDLLMRRVSSANPTPTPISTPTPGGTPSPVPPEANLIVNPGFENYEMGWSRSGPAVIDTSYLGASPHWGYLSYYRVANYGASQEERSTVFQTVSVVPGRIYELSAWYNVGAWTDQDLVPESFDRHNCFLLLVADPTASMGDDPIFWMWPHSTERLYCEPDPRENGKAFWAHATMRVTATGPEMQIGAVLGSVWVLTWHRLIVDDLALVEVGELAPATPTPSASSTPLETSTPAGPDLDGDGLADALEGGRDAGLQGRTNMYLFDSDGDGLGDGLEDDNRNAAWDAGETSPVIRDTDGDAFEDGVEVQVMETSALSASDPGVPLIDADSDLLPSEWDRDDGNRDFDEDRFLDGFEVVNLGTEADNAPFVRPGMGDVDGNQSVDNADAQKVLNFFASLSQTGFDSSRSDPGRNGSIDNADAQQLLNFFAHRSPLLPVD